MRFRTRFKIWKIRRLQRRSNAEWDRRIKESGKPADKCTSEPWYAHYAFEDIGSDAEIRKLVSDELEWQATALFLPVPWGDETSWETDGASPRTRYMTAQAMTDLRTAIRKERMARREAIEWWVKVIGGAVGILTGLIGALIGLVAVWRR
jgi:hypothetical protein